MKNFVLLFLIIIAFTFSVSAQGKKMDCDDALEIISNSSFGDTVRSTKKDVEDSFKEIKAYAGPLMNEELKDEFEKQYKDIQISLDKMLTNLVTDFVDRDNRKEFLSNPDSVDKRYGGQINTIISMLKNSKAQYLQIVSKTKAAFGLQEIVTIIAVAKEFYQMIIDQIKLKDQKEEIRWRTCLQSGFADQMKLKDYSLI